MTRYRTLAFALCALGVAACGDKTIQDISGPVNGSLIKFFNFAVNPSGTVSTPAVNFYDGTLKVTGASSSNCAPPNDTTTVCRTTGNESLSGTTYTNAGNGALYAIVAPGTSALTAKIVASGADSARVIATLNTSLVANTMYSFYLSGTYDPVAKTSDSFIIADSLPSPDLVNTYVRFVNASSNSPAMTLFAKLQATGVETGVGSTTQAYKSASIFQQLPAGVYDLNTRTAGSSTNVITRLNVSFVAGHVYTITARGDATSGVTANKPALDNTANR